MGDVLSGRKSKNMFLGKLQGQPLLQAALPGREGGRGGGGRGLFTGHLHQILPMRLPATAPVFIVWPMAALEGALAIALNHLAKLGLAARLSVERTAPLAQLRLVLLSHSSSNPS